jgi:hypothetical protein
MPSVLSSFKRRNGYLTQTTSFLLDFIACKASLSSTDHDKYKVELGMMILAEGSNEGTWKTVHSKTYAKVDVLDKDVGCEGTPGCASELYHVYDENKKAGKKDF